MLAFLINSSNPKLYFVALNTKPHFLHPYLRILSDVVCRMFPQTLHFTTTSVGELKSNNSNLSLSNCLKNLSWARLCFDSANWQNLQPYCDFATDLGIAFH